MRESKTIYQFSFTVGYALDRIETLSFFTLLESLFLFAVFRNLSRPPLKSTVRKAEFVTFNLTFLFKISLLKVIFLRFGKNLRLVLLLE